MFQSFIAGGRLTAEWKIREFGTNKVAENTLAVNNPNLKEKKTEYFPIKVWNKTAEVSVDYTSKGSLVAVQGTIQNEKWQYEGKDYYKIVVNVDKITFLDNKNTAGEHPQNDFAKVDAMFGDEEPDDDIFGI